MDERTEQTAETYKNHFRKFIENTKNMDQTSPEIRAWIDRFAEEIPGCGSVFEVGSAFGRDSAYLAEKGFRLLCSDIALEAVEELRARGFLAELYDVRDEPHIERLGVFDGVFANAVLLHFPEADFVRVVGNLRKLLKEGGILTFSVKLGDGEEMTTRKMDAPRYFRYYNEASLVETLAKVEGFTVLRIEQTPDGTWLLATLRKREDEQA